MKAYYQKIEFTDSDLYTLNKLLDCMEGFRDLCDEAANGSEFNTGAIAGILAPAVSQFVEFREDLERRFKEKRIQPAVDAELAGRDELSRDSDILERLLKSAEFEGRDEISRDMLERLRKSDSEDGKQAIHILLREMEANRNRAADQEGGAA